MSEDGLRFHYVNPKFAGLPWAIDKTKKKPWGSKKTPKQKRKHRRQYNAKFKWRNSTELKDRQAKARKFLETFWQAFEALPTSAMRLACLNKAARPKWPRVCPELRKKLRQEFARRYSYLLAEIDEYCGVCGDGVWKEKHHIVPLSHGGLNENINLIAICKHCHDEIHPWMKA